MSACTPKSLASSGQKPIQEMCHPLGAEEAVLTPSPDVRNITSSIGEKDQILPNGTPVETSSPSSSSSLLNRLQLDDDLDGETRDLFVTVDDPKKHVSTMETYITYRVVTKTTRVEFDLPEYTVRRRYQDFDWLRTKLEDSQPTHLIPPLPEKFVMKGVVDRFSEEFVETRRKALDKFLKRVADHPVLSFNEHLNSFLSAKDLNKRQGLALLSKMGESVKYVTGGYKLRGRPVEFSAMGDYLDMFTQKLGTIDRIAQRIIKEQSEYLAELKEYGPVYTTWAASEAELQGPLEGVASCMANCSIALDELTQDMSGDFLPVLREYVLYIESMKAVLKKRDNVQAEYEAKLEAAALRKEERPTAKVPTDVEKCQDRVECFNADLKSDWDQWQNNKTQDFRQLLTGMADHNIQYYEKCLAAWESVIPVLQDKQPQETETEED
ncbi:sorting nexin-30 [Oncorhynchus mykiss]|uniref:Sorting nexin-30 n=1 Tax=Oncorhynchus kisutch TaxID=8019 RepID=A0A8C7G8R1_ONCKI|nr:sorting nexin-30 [Oncorhynchus kisutch]XP_036832448.1 sorting nexin-30 [Oncorhynchus mykiss]